MAENGPTIQIPRWIQLVGLPVLAVLAWAVVGTVGHVLFLFLTAAVISFLLNTLVRDLERIRLPRGFGVAIVYLSFAAAIIVAVVALVTVVVAEVRSASDRVETYLTEERGQGHTTDAERDIVRLQGWLDAHGLEGIKVREQATEWLDSIEANDVSKYTGRLVDFAQGAAISVVSLLFSLVLVIVISIYMLLDMPRLERAIDRRFPPHGGKPLTSRIEAALAGYVKGQLLLSTIIGGSAEQGCGRSGRPGSCRVPTGTRSCSESGPA